MTARLLHVLSIALVLLAACNKPDKQPIAPALQLLSAKVGDTGFDLNTGQATEPVAVDRSIDLFFSSAVDTTGATRHIRLWANGQALPFLLGPNADRQRLTLLPLAPLPFHQTFELNIGPELRSADGGSFAGLRLHFATRPDALRLLRIDFDQQSLLPAQVATDVGLQASIRLHFNHPVATGQLTADNFKLIQAGGSALALHLSSTDSTVTLQAQSPLKGLMKYFVAVNAALMGANGEQFAGFSQHFFTENNPNPVFEPIDDQELLQRVQLYTFRYFWQGAEPQSGMARERQNSGNLVTTGGSGFGLMAHIVGVHRGFITRTEALERWERVLAFLARADRFHGVWPHWIDGTTGRTIAFSPNDNGGDLVETAFLAQGLLALRQYLDAGQAREAALIDQINTLLDGIEWTWYTRNGQKVLYWHWSPTKEWAMNMTVSGYNEALIVYVLAASSKNYRIDPQVYHQGWARSGGIRNGKSFYDIALPVGYDYGGPLFFAHYSFLGLDPRRLQDTYANYWQQNQAHSRINEAYCVANPRRYPGYGPDCWGLTASDESGGYAVHEPTRDNGTLTPTAALASMPYTPEASMRALRFFYYHLGDRIWGEYGFTDAFNLSLGWYADSYLAIDQGPIVVGIENHRSGLIWDLFMSAPEVQAALQHLGFESY